MDNVLFFLSVDQTKPGPRCVPAIISGTGLGFAPQTKDTVAWRGKKVEDQRWGSTRGSLGSRAGLEVKRGNSRGKRLRLC